MDDYLRYDSRCYSICGTAAFLLVSVTLNSYGFNADITLSGQNRATGQLL